jgi:flagellar M-ring protein FliF
MALPDLGALPELPPMQADESPSEAEEDDPVARLRTLIEERREETVEVLRGWMERAEEAR